MPHHPDFDDAESGRMPFDPLDPRPGESIDARGDEVLRLLRAGSVSRQHMRQDFALLSQRVDGIEQWQKKIDAGQLETLKKIRENTTATEAAGLAAEGVKRDTQQIVQFTRDMGGFVRISRVAARIFLFGMPLGGSALVYKFWPWVAEVLKHIGTVS